MTEVKEIEREGIITSPVGEEFIVRQKDNNVMVKIPENRRVSEKPEKLWITDTIHPKESAQGAAIRIVTFIIEKYPKI